MSNATVVKQFTFEAAHFLPEHDGKCRELHGHSYKVEIGINGHVQRYGPKNGMVVDFGDLSTWWKKIVDPELDHNCLNEISDFDTIEYPPTAENIASWIFQLATRWLDQDHGSRAAVRFVRVWETATGYAEVS